MKTILHALRALLVLTLLTGVLYPLVCTGLARVFFPWEAGGSLVIDNGRVIGSALLAQKFEHRRYFWPRPSAADYATVASGASNLGPTSAELRKVVALRREQFGRDAPPDLLTASGSGLDPHVSPAAARAQVVRVAEARRLPSSAIAALVEAHTEPPQLGFLGEPRVNILALNRALDRLP